MCIVYKECVNVIPKTVFIFFFCRIYFFPKSTVFEFKTIVNVLRFSAYYVVTLFGGFFYVECVSLVQGIPLVLTVNKVVHILY